MNELVYLEIGETNRYLSYEQTFVNYLRDSLVRTKTPQAGGFTTKFLIGGRLYGGLLFGGEGSYQTKMLRVSQRK